MPLIAPLASYVKLPLNVPPPEALPAIANDPLITPAVDVSVPDALVRLTAAPVGDESPDALALIDQFLLSVQLNVIPTVEPSPITTVAAPLTVVALAVVVALRFRTDAVSVAEIGKFVSFTEALPELSNDAVPVNVPDCPCVEPVIAREPETAPATSFAVPETDVRVRPPSLPLPDAVADQFLASVQLSDAPTVSPPENTRVPEPETDAAAPVVAAVLFVTVNVEARRLAVIGKLVREIDALPVVSMEADPVNAFVPLLPARVSDPET